MFQPSGAQGGSSAEARWMNPYLHRPHEVDSKFPERTPSHPIS